MPRRQIGPRQILFQALDAGPGHALRPKHASDRGIAETTRVLLADGEHDEIRHALIEVHEQTVLGMQICERAREPGDRGKVGDDRVRKAPPLAGIRLQRRIRLGLDQARLPFDLLQGTFHNPIRSFGSPARSKARAMRRG